MRQWGGRGWFTIILIHTPHKYRCPWRCPSSRDVDNCGLLSVVLISCDRDTVRLFFVHSLCIDRELTTCTYRMRRGRRSGLSGKRSSRLQPSTVSERLETKAAPTTIVHVSQSCSTSYPNMSSLKRRVDQSARGTHILLDGVLL